MLFKNWKYVFKLAYQTCVLTDANFSPAFAPFILKKTIIIIIIIFFKYEIYVL